MHALLIVSPSKEVKEKEVAKLLAPLSIDAIDITKVTAQNTIGIEEIRLLKRSVALKPFKSPMRAVIFEEAQTLTVEAQNALLKTLEEPPVNTIIILLVSTNVDALLPTIVSRCQVIHLQPTTYNLQPNEFSVLSSQFLVLTEGGLGERFALAEEAAKDRQTAISWLSDMILTIRRKLLTEVNRKGAIEDIPVYLQYLRAFQKAYNLLTTTNVNPRFTLETLFLSLPSNNSGTIQS